MAERRDYSSKFAVIAGSTRSRIGADGSHRAGMADGFLTKTVNRVGVQRAAFDVDKQFFEQRRQLVSLLPGEPLKGLLQHRPALGEQLSAPPSTGDRQMEGNGPAVAGWLSCEESVLLQ